MKTVWYFLLALVQLTKALNPIVANGNKLFDAVTNERFFVKGLGYSMYNYDKARPNIELTDIEACREHVELIKDLGVNLLRFHYIDSTKDHDECMKLLEKEKIYIALDLDGTNRPEIRETHYETTVLERYKKTIDTFDKYENVAFYFVGHEIARSANLLESNAFIKASIRDIKAYIKTKNHQILTGYVTSDSRFELETRKSFEDYQNCGSDEERPDFIGLNTYNWCLNYRELSDDNKFEEEYNRFGIPLFMSDFECKSIYERYSSEFKILFNVMNSVFSGGIINGFNAFDDSVFKLNKEHRVIQKNTAIVKHIRETLTQYPKSKHYKKDYILTKSKPNVCPAVTDSFKLHANLPPVTTESECECMFNRLTCIAEPRNYYFGGEMIRASMQLKCNRPNCASFVSYNYTSGEYGTASSCSERYRLSWLLNQHYLNSGSKKESCSSNLFQIANEGKPKTCFKHYTESNSSSTLYSNKIYGAFMMVFFSLLINRQL